MSSRRWTGWASLVLKELKCGLLEKSTGRNSWWIWRISKLQTIIVQGKQSCTKRERATEASVNLSRGTVQYRTLLWPHLIQYSEMGGTGRKASYDDQEGQRRTPPSPSARFVPVAICSSPSAAYKTINLLKLLWKFKKILAPPFPPPPIMEFFVLFCLQFLFCNLILQLQHSLQHEPADDSIVSWRHSSASTRCWKQKSRRSKTGMFRDVGWLSSETSEGGGESCSLKGQRNQGPTLLLVKTL